MKALLGNSPFTEFIGWMNVFLRNPLEKKSPHIRTHPWGESVTGQGRYYDFKKVPELIPLVLEDFKTWESYQAVQDFYKLLQWLNGPNSTLESNDCALRGPHANTRSPHFQQDTQCELRLMFFYRHLVNNIWQRQITWLVNCIHEELSNATINSSATASHCIEIALIEAAFMTLAHLSEDEKVGWELDLTVWAFGDSEVETMTTLGTVIGGLHTGLQRVSAIVAKT